MKRIALALKTLLPVSVLLALSDTALAEKKETRVSAGLTAGQFIRNCEGMNGTVAEGSQSSEGVKCTLPSGTTADCSFGPKDAYCEVTTPGRTIPGSATKGLLGSSVLAPIK
jgi:hypothetical protein